MSRLDSLVFLWRRCAYGGSCKTSHGRRFQKRFLCRFAWQAWHFVTFTQMSQWHPQHFGHVHLHFAWQAHFRRVVLRVCGESDC